MQQIIILVLGLILAIPTYGTSIIVAIYVFNKNGKRVRNAIFHNLINEAYKYSEGELLTTDLIFFESAIKFAEENGGKLSQFKDSIAFNTVALSDEVVVVFSKDFNNNLQYIVDNSKKLEMKMMEELGIDTNSVKATKDVKKSNLDSEELNDKSKVRRALSSEEIYQKYNREELNNHAKTVGFLFKVPNSIDTDGRIISKWSEEEISIASEEYDRLNLKIVSALKFVDLIELLDLDLDTDNEIYEYKDWLINEYYPESKRIHNQSKSSGNYDEVSELLEKLLDSLVNRIISIDKENEEMQNMLQEAIDELKV